MTIAEGGLWCVLAIPGVTLLAMMFRRFPHEEPGAWGLRAWLRIGGGLQLIVIVGLLAGWQARVIDLANGVQCLIPRELTRYSISNAATGPGWRIDAVTAVWLGLLNWLMMGALSIPQKSRSTPWSKGQWLAAVAGWWGATWSWTANSLWGMAYATALASGASVMLVAGEMSGEASRGVARRLWISLLIGDAFLILAALMASDGNTITPLPHFWSEQGMQEFSETHGSMLIGLALSVTLGICVRCVLLPAPSWIETTNQLSPATQIWLLMVAILPSGWAWCVRTSPWWHVLPSPPAWLAGLAGWTILFAALLAVAGWNWRQSLGWLTVAVTSWLLIALHLLSNERVAVWGGIALISLHLMWFQVEAGHRRWTIFPRLSLACVVGLLVSLSLDRTLLLDPEFADSDARVFAGGIWESLLPLLLGGGGWLTGVVLGRRDFGRGPEFTKPAGMADRLPGIRGWEVCSQLLLLAAWAAFLRMPGQEWLLVRRESLAASFVLLSLGWLIGWEFTRAKSWLAAWVGKPVSQLRLQTRGQLHLEDFWNEGAGQLVRTLASLVRYLEWLLGEVVPNWSREMLKSGSGFAIHGQRRISDSFALLMLAAIVAALLGALASC